MPKAVSAMISVAHKAIGAGFSSSAFQLTSTAAMTPTLRSSISGIDTTLDAKTGAAITAPRPSQARNSAEESSSTTCFRKSWGLRIGTALKPVIRDADKKGIFDIAAETSALAAKARDGKLAPADMQGGTFSISSLGGIGGTYFTPIINAPEVAILGVCRSSIKPVWDGKQFAPRLMLPLSLSWDHRVVDGASAARFNAHLAALLSDFRRVML